MQRYHAAHNCSWPMPDGEFVRYDDAQAEIARLKLERAYAQDSLDAAKEEIARLTAELDELKASNHGLWGRLETCRQDEVKLKAERDRAKELLQLCIKGNKALKDKTQIALAQAAAAAMEMRERAERDCRGWDDLECDPSINLISNSIRALPIDPDAQKALDRLLAKAREDAIREMDMPGSFIDSWHKVTEWCEAEGETVSAQTAWGEVKQAILALLTDGGRDE